MSSRNRHWHSSRDKNEPDIINQLESMGYKVCKLASTSDTGLPDLLVGGYGRWVVVEVKDGYQPLREKQAQFRDNCIARGLPWFLMDDLDDTLQFDRLMKQGWETGVS